MSIEELLSLLFVWVLGSIIGSLITTIILGFLGKHFVVNKVMENREVIELKETFKEGIELLRRIIKKQKEEIAA